jgi:hypothetical protein
MDNLKTEETKFTYNYNNSKLLRVIAGGLFIISISIQLIYLGLSYIDIWHIIRYVSIAVIAVSCFMNNYYIMIVGMLSQAIVYCQFMISFIEEVVQYPETYNLTNIVSAILTQVGLIIVFLGISLFCVFTLIKSEKAKKVFKYIGIILIICVALMAIHVIIDFIDYMISYASSSFAENVMYFIYNCSEFSYFGSMIILLISFTTSQKEITFPASSTAYGKSYKSLVPHVLLLLFTCGIYYLVWIYRTTDSLNACKNEEYRTPVNKLLLCMFVPFYSIYWTYKSAHRIDTLGYEKGIQGDTATLSLILSLFVPILPPILMQSKLNSVIMADSVSPAVATAMQYAAEPVDNGYNDLEKLKELYDKGVITEEEFTEKKKQVLGI